jgi:oligo-1,6-glucosidase
MKKQWWHDKIAYQIYPKSFYDSNGDGIGDLPGIISKLDYLRDLGIDIIWISPIFCSPFADQGYDISNYYDIDPIFGTMEDMERLLAEAKKRNMHILMDLVVNHCSDEHEWFQKACEDPDGKYGKYFYIETVKDGKLPCNWRSYFGGSAWEPLPGHSDKYYLHLFHKKQPDLNWENKEVREAIYKMVNWWLDKGLDGFRIDAIINIKKALPWKDYPADRDDGFSAIDNMIKDANGIGDFLNELKEHCFKPHHALTVGEVFNDKDEELPDFIGEDGYFSSMFDFATAGIGRSDNGSYDYTPVTPEAYKEAFFKNKNRLKGNGFYSNIIENHDEPRGASHYIPEADRNDTSKKMLATLQILSRGLPFLYQGQEIGMENIKFHSIDQVDDIGTIAEYQVALEAGLSKEDALAAVNKYSRDNSRTPFQWNTSRHAGFTTGTPWLLVNPNYTSINLENQLENPESVYNYYKELIELRKNPDYKDIFVYGDMVPYAYEQENLLAFTRSYQGETILVAANYQSEPQKVKLHAPIDKILLSNTANIDVTNQTLTLDGYQSLIIKLRFDF